MTDGAETSDGIGRVRDVPRGSDADAMVAVDVIAKDGDGAGLLKDLQASGTMTGGASWGAMASGYVKAGALAALDRQSDVVSATLSQSGTRAGRVDNEADQALMADTARSTSGYDGTGVTVGILSDSFDTSASKDPQGNADTEATDIASGDLPANTVVLNDSPNGTDEGRAMAEVVHDIAPGAAIKFDTANGGQAVFAQHILDLANAGCKVIVDDASYYAELSYQDGPIAQAIDEVEAMGVTYVSAAGNDGSNGYESAFHAGGRFTYQGTAYTRDLFGGRKTLAFTAGAEQSITLEWAQPGASAGGKGSASDLAVFITNANGRILNPGGEGVAETIGGDPVQVVQPTLRSGQRYFIKVGLEAGSAAPSDVRILVQDDGSGAKLATASGNENSGTFYGHAAATGAISVAAAAYTQTPRYGTAPAKLESFSSSGPDDVYYDAAGNALATPEARQVDLTGVDGGETTFFGFGKGPNGYPRYFGTSAAAPSVAGVAALMLQKDPGLTPDQVKTILESTATSAVDSAGAVDPAATGAGLVDAAAALAATPTAAPAAAASVVATSATLIATSGAATAATSAAATPAVCFAQGTRIRLAGGADIAVQDLAIGDLVETASGGRRPIRWLGHRTLRPGAHAMPSAVLPVRVSAGAFGCGRPERDLLLSPGHPVLVGADADDFCGDEFGGDDLGGHLVPIMCLINGTSIRKVEVETVTYWHVELDAHDLLLAEGLPAESYLDGGDRIFFTEAADHALANPDFVVPGLSGRCRPVAVEGPVVEAERRRLAATFASQLSAACAWPNGDRIEAEVMIASGRPALL